jgi:drug/metabolite transporter (DMT)-like permease
MKELRGYVMILGSAIFWGTSATAAKALFNQQLDTVLVVQARVTVSMVLLLAFYLLFRRDFLRIDPRELWKFALLGCIGVAGTNYTYYFTIKETTVATAILIQYTAPLLVMLYAVWSGEERFTGAKVVAVVLSLGGCFLAVGAYDREVLRITPLGLLTGIGSIFGFAFLTIFTRSLLKTHGVWTSTFYAMVFASLFWVVLNPPWVVAAQSLTAWTWGALVVLAVLSLLIPQTLFFGGLRRIVPSRAIITSTFEPIVAIVSAAWFLGEGLQPLQILGALLVITAILLLHAHPEEHFGA